MLLPRGLLQSQQFDDRVLPGHVCGCPAVPPAISAYGNCKQRQQPPHLLLPFGVPRGCGLSSHRRFGFASTLRICTPPTNCRQHTAIAEGAVFIGRNEPALTSCAAAEPTACTSVYLPWASCYPCRERTSWWQTSGRWRDAAAGSSRAPLARPATLAAAQTAARRQMAVLQTALASPRLAGGPQRQMSTSASGSQWRLGSH